MKLVVLIPCKDLDRGKSRLAGCLAPRARAALCAFFLRRTLDVAIEALGRRCVRVVTGDRHVAAIAAEHGVGVIADGGGGLNVALEHGRARILSEAGNCAGLILPIDLPLATAGALTRIAAERHAAVIVPDENGAGTNILRLAPAALRRFPFCYGPHSYARHTAAARRIGIDIRRIDDPELMFDVDRPEQYRRWAPGDPAWRAVISGGPLSVAR
jgi:2-phospho-L-lactate/phosphoenolpyruvate guanylyltransferase